MLLYSSQASAERMEFKYIRACRAMADLLLTINHDRWQTVLMVEIRIKK